jgi:hypothetical protein
MTRLRQEFERKITETQGSGGGTTTELLISLRKSWVGSSVQSAARTAAQNPIASMLLAAGAVCLVYGFRHRMARDLSWHRRMGEAEEIAILNTGHARIYDPDASPRHPTQDVLESRREMSARI